MNAKVRAPAASVARAQHHTGDRAEAGPRSDVHKARGLPDADFDRLLSAWGDDPDGQRIEVSIRLTCSGLVLRVSDREAVIAMLRGEQERRRQMREVSP